MADNIGHLIGQLWIHTHICVFNVVVQLCALGLSITVVHYHTDVDHYVPLVHMEPLVASSHL